MEYLMKNQMCQKSQFPRRISPGEDIQERLVTSKGTAVIYLSVAVGNANQHLRMLFSFLSFWWDTVLTGSISTLDCTPLRLAVQASDTPLSRLVR